MATKGVPDYSHGMYVNAKNPTVCASEGERCSCVGTVLYGSKSASSYTDFLKTKYAVAESSDSIPCENVQFSSDPLPGTVKKCYCLPNVRV